MLASLIVVSPLDAAVEVAAESKLIASDGSMEDRFGSAVAIVDDLIVVGADLDDYWGIDSGSVYVYEQNGDGTHSESRLTPSDYWLGMRFGYSVAASGDLIVVGAVDEGSRGRSAGAVYVFARSNDGTYAETKLTASDAIIYGGFGWAVATDGHRIVVGTTAGVAYVYEPDGVGGYVETHLLPPDPLGYDRYGNSVAISGDRIVVGAPTDWEGSQATGAAYLFEADGADWQLARKFKPADLTSHAKFGESVAIAGDRIVVGAYDDYTPAGESAGSAYLYESNGVGDFTETRLTATDGYRLDRFGWSVALNDDLIVIGARDNDDYGTSSGSIYLFTQDPAGQYQQTKLLASDASRFDSYGHALALTNERLVIGAYGDDDNGEASGSAYVYDLDASPASLADLATRDDGTRLAETIAAVTAACDALGDDLHGSTVNLLGIEHEVVIARRHAEARGRSVNERGGYLAPVTGDGPFLIVGSPGGDDLISHTADDVMCGLGGDDVLNGKTGNDLILGGAGPDRLKATAGLNVLAGDESDLELTGGVDFDWCSNVPRAFGSCDVLF